MLLLFAVTTIRPPSHSIRPPIFYKPKTKKQSANSATEPSHSTTEFDSIRTPISSISTILRHFHNNLHLDSKLVMMPNYQPPCYSFPCFPLHQVAPQVYTLTSSAIGMSSAFSNILVSNYTRNSR